MDKDKDKDKGNEAPIVYDQDDIAAMTPDEVINIMMLKPKIEGVGVVKRADGTIKYDDESTRGSYGEELLD